GTWRESRGARRRAADEEERRESWSGLLMRHLRGEMAEEEFIGRLRERNLPLPAPKLVWTAPPALALPPNFWQMRRDWDRRLEELRREATHHAALDGPARTDDRGPAPSEPVGLSELSPAAPAPNIQDAAAVRLEIRTLGEISIRVDGVDIAPVLLHRAAQACPVLYLVTRE